MRVTGSEGEEIKCKCRYNGYFEKRRESLYTTMMLKRLKQNNVNKQTYPQLKERKTWR